MDEATDPTPLYACRIAGQHLLNALLFTGVQPDEIGTQWEALQQTWPTAWAYDAWCSWHACRVSLRKAGWALEEISQDRRMEWRTSAIYIQEDVRPGNGSERHFELRQAAPTIEDLTL